MKQITVRQTARLAAIYSLAIFFIFSAPIQNGVSFSAQNILDPGIGSRQGIMFSYLTYLQGSLGLRNQLGFNQQLDLFVDSLSSKAVSEVTWFLAYMSPVSLATECIFCHSNRYIERSTLVHGKTRPESLIVSTCICEVCCCSSQRLLSL